MPCLYLIGDLHLDTLGDQGGVANWWVRGVFKMLKSSGSNELAGFYGWAVTFA